MKKIPRRIRRNIFDGLQIEGIYWSGRLSNIDFLGRLYDLDEMPSFDNRYADAAGDIYQHTINNDDWEPDWIFADSRFNLGGCPDNEFLNFLCETVHPLVRPDHEEAAKIVTQYNDQLKQADFELVEVEKIAGRIRYEARDANPTRIKTDEVRRVADTLKAGHLHKQIQRAENAVAEDPDLAIGTAKEMVETCCKTILADLGETVAGSVSFSGLVKQTVKVLKLTRDDVLQTAKGAEHVRIILSNLTSITHQMNELRALYGTGHGPDGRRKGLEPRHAHLAVSSAIALVVFLSDTHKSRQF